MTSDQVLKAARIINAVSDIQTQLTTLKSELHAMRATGADGGLLQDALDTLADCEPELAHNLGQILGHEEIMEALDAMQLEEEEVCV